MSSFYSSRKCAMKLILDPDHPLKFSPVQLLVRSSSSSPWPEPLPRYSVVGTTPLPTDRIPAAAAAVHAGSESGLLWKPTPESGILWWSADRHRTATTIERLPRRREHLRTATGSAPCEEVGRRVEAWLTRKHHFRPLARVLSRRRGRKCLLRFSIPRSTQLGKDSSRILKVHHMGLAFGISFF